jgi:hypothetical protein
MLKFVQCLREHGVNASADPQGRGLRIQGEEKQGTGKLEAATKACRAYSPKKDLNPNDPKARDHMLKMAQCLRGHGVNVPDSQPGQGLIIQGNPGDQAKLEKADQACRHLLDDGSSQP